MTRIAVVGPGRIGGNLARRWVDAGHDVTVTFSRDREALDAFAASIGARADEPAAAVDQAEVVVLSTPWSAIEDALAATGPLDGRVVVDTTNPFGGGTPVPAGTTTTQLHQQRLPDAYVVKAFNTLTSGFQVSAAGRTGTDRVVIFLAGDDLRAKQVVSGLAEEIGFEPVDLGPAADSGVMEAPRRAGAVYGEEYHLADAQAVVAAVRAGKPLPPTPSYGPPSPA